MLHCVSKPRLRSAALWGLVALGGSLAYAQSLQDVGRYAKALYAPYVESGSEERNAKDRREAFYYLAHTRPAKLAVDLNRVRRHYGLRTQEGVGATYLLALKGIDFGRNLDHLGSLHMGLNYDAIEGVPAALADIAVKRHSRRAAMLLVAMKTDGHLAEDQSLLVTQLFVSSPMLIIAGVGSSPHLWPSLKDQLRFGVSEANIPLAKVHSISRELARKTKGRERQLLGQLAKLSPLTPGD